MKTDSFDLQNPSARIFVLVCVFVLLVGCVFRIWHITQNQFLFYDEGFYLSHNRMLGETIKVNYPLGTADLKEATRIYFKTCLASGKSLWFMLSDIRVFFGRVHDWFWPRAIASVCGMLTIFLVYCFAVRFFESRRIAWVSAALLAVLPSHVFYSRTGLQEALSTLLVLIGFYFYLFPRRFSWKVFLSGLFFGASYFSNYRLIMLPALVLVTEVWMSCAERRAFALRKYVWGMLTFFSAVILIGSLFDGQNIYLIFSWILHQGDLAVPEFALINFLSYPYYLFRLENWMLGIFFFVGALIVFRKRDFSMMLPFVLVISQMIIFSLPQEKGARYLCVVLPFLAMSVAYVIDYGFEHIRMSYGRVLLGVMVVLMFGMLMLKSYRIAEIRSDYQDAAEFLLAKNPNVKFLSTQKYVMDLYARDEDQVREVPVSFKKLLSEVSRGYEFLVLDPQAYIAFPAEGRFSLGLESQYEYVRQKFEPLRVFDHFDPVMMERFVFEHSSNLVRSTEFLRLAGKYGFSKIYIYDLKLVVPAMLEMYARIKFQQGAGDDR